MLVFRKILRAHQMNDCQVFKNPVIGSNDWSHDHYYLTATSYFLKLRRLNLPEHSYWPHLNILGHHVHAQDHKHLWRGKCQWNLIPLKPTIKAWKNTHGGVLPLVRITL